MRFFMLAAILFVSFWSGLKSAHAVGFAHGPNFVVFTPEEASDDASQAFALRVLAKADEYRRQIALEWFEEELPEGAGRAVINIMFSSNGEASGTWAKDHQSRTHHKIFLSTTRDRALGNTLQHEIAHVVFSTKYTHDNPLPIWLEEGIASRYDDDKRKQKRQQVLNNLVQTGDVPDLQVLFDRERLAAQNFTGYAAAVSLTDCLLRRGDKQSLLRFAEAAQRDGFDRALWDVYSIHNVRELQLVWRAQLSQSNDPASKVTSFVTSRY